MKYNLEYGKGKTPLYSQVKDILLDGIKNGVYVEKIPTEKELQDLFGVSRMTIRLATDELVADGFLVRQRAKGTKVVKSKIEENLNTLCNFSTEMKNKNINYKTHFVSLNVIKATAVIAEALELKKGTNVYEIHRVYYIDDKPFCSIYSYLPSSLNLTVDESVYYGSLYEYLKNEKGIDIVKSYEDIEVGFADHKLSQELDIKVGDAVLFRTRRSFDQNNHHVEFTLTYYKAGNYKYSLVLMK